MKRPEIVNATQAELDEILALAKTTFPLKQYKLLEGVLGTFVYMMRALQNARTSIKRFRNMLFGASTESQRNLLPLLDAGGASAAGDAASAAGAKPAQAAQDGAQAKVSAPGHGRNGAQAYSDSPVVQVQLLDLNPGDLCPQCETGKVYNSPPRTLVRLVGQAPIAATVYELSRLRCRLCDAVFTAVLPAGVFDSKYDHSCASMLALLRYGSGMPFYRLQGLQANLNVPLPDATQWDIVLKALPGPKAVFQELIVQAAQAPLLHNDDTPMRILELMDARTQAERAGQEPKGRAINTSGVVAVFQEHKVVLFFTGHAHAGENLQKVLAHRAQELQAPTQMSDALAANFTGEFKTIVSKCLTHGRRKVVDVLEHFPQPCHHVIKVLAQVYAQDAHCRELKMTPEQRLLHHQEHSAGPMQELQRWMNDQLEQRLVEPNSGLGNALRYLLKHWEGLTLFLRKAGAPLDNNLCERALKRAILHRRGSLFYKTVKGAELGDIYMSLIHTCQLCNVNAFDYLQALQIHAQQVQVDAARWLPWNYREQLVPTG